MLCMEGPKTNFFPNDTKLQTEISYIFIEFIFIEMKIFYVNNNKLDLDRFGK